MHGDRPLDAPPQRLGQRRVAARALANSVAPPSGGMRRAERSEQSDGTGLKELSLCQSMLASW